jgi:hypothetical protein
VTPAGDQRRPSPPPPPLTSPAPPAPAANRRRALVANRRRALVAGVAVLAITGSACGRSPHRSSAPRRSAPTTTAPTTTNTTVPAPPPTYPLTGLPAPSVAATRHPALVVKIDNVAQALPQSGIGNADVVYEEMVESGLTRLAAVFQSQQAGPLGPVRSGRTTDIGIVDDLNRPLFAFSGANAIFLTEIRAAPIVDVDAERDPGAYYRAGPHVIPHNLYTSTAALYALDPHATNAPPALFTYRAGGAPVTAAGAHPAATVSLTWPLASASWRWQPGPGQWARVQDGNADVDAAGHQVEAANVVVQAVTYVTDGVATGEGLPPTPIPKGVLVGTGRAWIFTGGEEVEGTWSRPASGTVTAYTDAAGHPVALAPGRTWVELIPAGEVPAVAP